MSGRVFALAPDASAARRVRLRLALSGVGGGVKVGVWEELVEEVRKSWLLAPSTPGWAERAAEAAAGMPDAYWSGSMASDGTGTSAEVVAFLDAALRSRPDGAPWDAEGLPPRTRRRLADLHALHEAMGRELPPDLAVVRAALDADPADAPLRFPVVATHGTGWLGPWQRALALRLNEVADGPVPQAVADALSDLGDEGGRAPEGAPGHLAANLFSGRKGILRLGGGIMAAAVRDAMEGAECVAGMARRLADAGTPFTDIGLSVPDDGSHARFLKDAFGLAGIPLAGLPDRKPLRDLGGELVRHAVMLHMGPPPKMAMASLLTSPLMPWPVEIGRQLAGRVFDGDFRLRPPDGMDPRHEKALGILRMAKGGHIGVVETLDALARHAVGAEVHVARVRSLASAIAAACPAGSDPDWERLLGLAGRVPVAEEGRTQFPKDGVKVFTEGHEPWGECRHLLVLGFSEGRYPSVPGPSASLLDGEAEAVNRLLGWELPTVASQVGAGRRSLVRQLAAASDTATFVVPRRAEDGSPLRHSDTMTFIARLADVDAERIAVDVHAPDAAARLPWLAVGEPSAAVAPRRPVPDDIDMGRDLLAAEEGGQPKPVSPSDLETLQASPFAWLLRRLGATPDRWEPDSMDPRVQGNLAHAVFESLFRVGSPLPDRVAVPGLVDEALAEAIRRQAPLVAGGMWKVERHSLRSTLVKAALRWRDILEATGAEVVGAEIWLQGAFAGVPIHGKADEALRLPDGRIVVADLKKASSPKRRDRMQKGQDSQASLYREMLATGGPKSGDGPLAGAVGAGVLYFNLNDAVALVDEAARPASPVPGVVVVPGDVSAEALAEIRSRIAEVRRGAVAMNASDDARTLESKGLSPSALNESPLVAMFARPSGSGEGDDGEEE